MSKIDIINIDARIKKKYREEIDKITEYKEKLYELQKTLQTNLSFRIKCEVQKNIKKISKKIENTNNLYFYISESAYLLEDYKKILQTPVKMNFLGQTSNENESKKEVVIKYLEIARKYSNLDIEISSTNSKKVKCNNCKNAKGFDIIDNSVYICLLCGSQQEIILHTSNYKDIDRINISSKYTYDRKVHFRDCINQYQGKQNSNIDKQVYIDLEDQFKKHHLLVGKDTDRKEKRFKNITKEHIHIFLKELNFTRHYENVNLIHYQLTGIKPDDISYLEDKLLNDFDLLTDLYDKKFKNKIGFERKNFINTQYVLFQLLSRYNHPCKREDFTILKTVDRKSFHDEVAKSCFEELGWNHTPMF